MASSGKTKTTMAKLNRERKLVERRAEKKARKDARKLAATLEPAPEGDETLDALPQAERAL
jgi:hypothetical protein